MPIRKLDEQVIHRIRAGEVIQRPRDVVKELLENAIDAGAPSITVRIEKGGKKLIEVNDSGPGMSPEDARICAEPHTTSKVSVMEDLDGIATLGFRGEALHSIASVSMMSLRTKTVGSDFGTEVSSFGDKISAKAVGGRDGTYVSVKELFYNVPPRKAALGSDSAETAAITKMVGRFILLYPEIEFSYYVNKASKMMRRKDMSEKSVISMVFGANISSGVKEVSIDVQGGTVKGFVGSPMAVRRTSDGIVLSVNGRYIEQIQPYVKMIRDAYRRTIQTNEYPVAILRVTIDPKSIDPNVHPQKSAVNLFDPALFKRLVYDAVISGQPALVTPMKDRYFDVSQVAKDAPLVLSPDPKENVSNDFGSDSIGKVESYPSESVPESELVEEHRMPFPAMKAIGQYDKTFILAEGDQYLFVVDQHALHEKVIYEELCDKQEIEFVEPLASYTLNLTAEDSDLLESSLDIFTEAGLEIEPFGTNTWRVYRIPAFRGQAIPETEIVDLIRDTIDNLSDEPDLDEFRLKILAEVACKSAIRANDVLNIHEMNGLLEKATMMRDAYYCPHGRPTSHALSQSKIYGWVKRK